MWTNGKKTTDIWSRKQGPNESTDDYIAMMENSARLINMPESSLCDAIIQGLHPDIRLFVLHSGSETIEQIQNAARTSEAAQAANSAATNSQFDMLSKQMEQILQKLNTASTNATV